MRAFGTPRQEEDRVRIGPEARRRRAHLVRLPVDLVGDTTNAKSPLRDGPLNEYSPLAHLRIGFDRTHAPIGRTFRKVAGRGEFHFMTDSW